MRGAVVRRFLVGAVAAFLVSAMPADGVAAQTQVSTPIAQTFATGISCLDAFDATMFAFTACSGAWNGNNLGAGNANPSNPSPGDANTRAFISSTWGINGPGADFSAGGSIFGDFVLAVKGSNSFSLFYFQGFNGTLDPAFGMVGVGLTRNGKVQGLSHATVYGGTVTVPEPGLLLLLVSGLLGLGLVTLRRRESVLG